MATKRLDSRGFAEMPQAFSHSVHGWLPERKSTPARSSSPQRTHPHTSLSDRVHALMQVYTYCVSPSGDHHHLRPWQELLRPSALAGGHGSFERVPTGTLFTAIQRLGNCARWQQVPTQNAKLPCPALHLWPGTCRTLILLEKSNIIRFFNTLKVLQVPATRCVARNGL